jgi:double-stranded uracil-DNA glycosylase
VSAGPYHDRLPDLLRPGLRVVFCGTAAGRASAARRAYYAGPGNKFWRTLCEIGLTPRQLSPHEFPRLLDHGIGLTDLCKVGAGSDREVARFGFDLGRLRDAAAACRPRVIAFNGKKGGQVALGRVITEYGRQPEEWEDTGIYVLPSTSGAANGFWDIGPWRELAAALG